MNKAPRLSKSGIEYLTHSWGIWSGCNNWQNGVCGGFNCWAKSLATRFKQIYPNGFEPTFYPEALDSPKYLKKPSRIAVGWVGDVIGYASPAVRIAICDAIKQSPLHKFLFLTKNPERLKEWEFPENCWVGVTATSLYELIEAHNWLISVHARVKYISFEPLLSWGDCEERHACKLEYIFKSFGEYPHNVIDWVIIGAQTKPYKPPKIEWVQEIVEACDKTGVKVFLKDNLKPLLQQNKHNLYSFPKWAGTQFAVTGDYSLAPVNPHPNEAMRKLRQEIPQ